MSLLSLPLLHFYPLSQWLYHWCGVGVNYARIFVFSSGISFLKWNVALCWKHVIVYVYKTNESVCFFRRKGRCGGSDGRMGLPGGPQSQWSFSVITLTPSHWRLSRRQPSSSAWQLPLSWPTCYSSPRSSMPEVTNTVVSCMSDCVLIIAMERKDFECHYDKINIPDLLCEAQYWS